jgi:hypothetical protein
MSRSASTPALDPGESTTTSSDQEQPMPNPRAGTTPTPPRLAPTVNDAVDLLERYAAADRDLATELDRIAAEQSPARRVSQATVTRLLRLLEESLVPGVQAKADLEALPNSLRWAGLTRWTQQAVDRAQPRPIEATA